MQILGFRLQQNYTIMINSMLENIAVDLSNIFAIESAADDRVQELGCHLMSDVVPLVPILRDERVIDPRQSPIKDGNRIKQGAGKCVGRQNQATIVRDSSVYEVCGPAKRLGDRFDRCGSRNLLE